MFWLWLALPPFRRQAHLGVDPLCHPIALTGLEVSIEPLADGSGLRLEASARTVGQTGVEMEALTAVQVGLLTLYDMLKSADPAMTITLCACSVRRRPQRLLAALSDG